MSTQDCLPAVSLSPNAEARSLSLELHSIKALLDDAYRRHSVLLSRLDSLHPPAQPGASNSQGTSGVVNPTALPDFWTVVAATNGRRCSPPVVVPDGNEFCLMDRNSERLHDEFEELCFKIESLGMCCILSGPIPPPSRGSEYFSRLYGLHQWLCHFCRAAGFNFISNFDSFWTRHDLFNTDRFHPSREGIRLLTSSLLNYIAFGID